MVRGGLAVGEYILWVCNCITYRFVFVFLKLLHSKTANKHIKRSDTCVGDVFVSLDHLVYHGRVSKTIVLFFKLG